VAKLVDSECIRQGEGGGKTGRTEGGKGPLPPEGKIGGGNGKPSKYPCVRLPDQKTQSWERYEDRV